MPIQEILAEHAWELVPRQAWTAITDNRPACRAAFGTARVGKIVGTHLYVTLTRFSSLAQELIRGLGREPRALKSSNGTRAALYWGFDMQDVTESDLHALVRALAAAIDEALDQAPCPALAR